MRTKRWCSDKRPCHQAAPREQTDAVNERVIEYLLTSEKANVATALSVVALTSPDRGRMPASS